MMNYLVAGARALKQEYETNENLKNLAQTIDPTINLIKTKAAEAPTNMYNSIEQAIKNQLQTDSNSQEDKLTKVMEIIKPASEFIETNSSPDGKIGKLFRDYAKPVQQVMSAQSADDAAMIAIDCASNLLPYGNVFAPMAKHAYIPTKELVCGISAKIKVQLDIINAEESQKP